MGEINVTDKEIDAIKAIDERELSALINEAIHQERSSSLLRLPLSDCGPYVANHLHLFEVALKRYREAKTAKRQEQTALSARSAGSDLLFAFQQMKRRMETEERNRLSFFIEDNIFWPSHFTKDLSVTVSYRYRNTPSDEWAFGTITFRHQFIPTLRYSTTQSTKKPSASKQAATLQEELASQWNYLMKSALYTVRDYFVDGGDGGKIPDHFEAVPDRTGQLNNFSLRFWGTVESTPAQSISGNDY